MTLCIRPHDVGKDTPEALAEKIHALGFQGVQLAIAKAIKDQNGNPDTLTEDVCKEIKAGFNKHNVEIPLLGAYFNPVHSNKEKVKAGAEKFADHLRKAHLFGAKYVASETGSYNDEPWIYHPKNQTEEAFEEVYSVFKPLADVAKEAGSFLTVEGAWGHCMYCPAQMERLVKALDNGNIRVTVDIYNYLYEKNYEQRFDILDECLDRFGDKIAVFHIKDFNVNPDGTLREVGIKDGIMGWDKMLPKIKKAVPNALLVFEGMKDLENSLEIFKSYL
ncbi:MAG: sugar phosphate isomerase/epimerase [Spirochaetaceae bacterium]|nr:sugar phosphate isomerase/epimerase [Spirochaetaceae bacterium]MBQ4556004.1 sugar phosphate isomerase/epimerase [Spirochaetaceae bacterium]